MNNQSIINLHKTRIALEQRVRALKDPTLTEGKDVSKLLYKMESMLENITQQLQTVEEMPAEISFGDDSEPDHEVEMARSELYRAGQAAVALEKMLHHVSEQQGLEGWVQAKITKAADYLESVYHYLDYEMKGSGMHEAVAAYSPGQDPNDPNGNPNNPQAANPQAPGAPQQNPNSSPTGQQSATPDSGGSTPAVTSPGMVKMAKLDQNKKPSGTPIMVKSADISSKQKQGFFVIGESRISEGMHVYCPNCGEDYGKASEYGSHRLISCANCGWESKKKTPHHQSTTKEFSRYESWSEAANAVNSYEHDDNLEYVSDRNGEELILPNGKVVARWYNEKNENNHGFGYGYVVSGLIGESKEQESKMQRVDMKGMKCTSCKKGTYQETSQMDDMDGIVHCTKCGKGVKRHQSAKPKEKGVSEGHRQKDSR